MKDLRESYKATTLRILGSFQLLEFALKVYIGKSYDVIKASVGEKFHFDYSIADVESFPLERLLTVFAKLNSNSDLIKRLNKMREKRNHIAHKSLLLTMGPMYDPAAIEDTHYDYFWLEDELAECLQLLIGETKLLKEVYLKLCQNTQDVASNLEDKA
jgi:hypothetical protein